MLKSPTGSRFQNCRRGDGKWQTASITNACAGEREQASYKCECVACPNRTTESHIIMSTRTLVQEEIKYLPKNGGIGNE